MSIILTVYSEAAGEWTVKSVLGGNDLTSDNYQEKYQKTIAFWKEVEDHKQGVNHSYTHTFHSTSHKPVFTVSIGFSITFPIEHVHSLMIFMNSDPTAYHICNNSILCMIIIAFYGLLCTAGLYGLQ